MRIFTSSIDILVIIIGNLVFGEKREVQINNAPPFIIRAPTINEGLG